MSLPTVSHQQAHRDQPADSPQANRISQLMILKLIGSGWRQPPLCPERGGSSEPAAGSDHGEVPPQTLPEDVIPSEEPTIYNERWDCFTEP